MQKYDQPNKNCIAAVKVGTTVATNALLERTGEKTLLLTSSGMCEAMQIGYQQRPELFALHVVLPKPLYSESVALNERVDANGLVLVELDVKQLTEVLQVYYKKGYRSVAIAFLHSYAYNKHEILAGDIAKKLGYSQISLSYKVSPLIKYVLRADTAVVDAYLSPVLQNYVQKVTSGLGDVAAQRLYFMQSSGGLVKSSFFQGKDAVLSGPAGGVVGMVKSGEAAGFRRLIGFDMGGTSTDVSHYSGEYERSNESNVSGVRMRSPMMHIHTVAAGGGSILSYKNGRFLVGPDSAGANPGPACYGKDGPLTVTDANVMLGRIQGKYFPKVFGSNGDKPLNISASKKLFSVMAKILLQESTQNKRSLEEIAEGFLEIATENMSNAIKKISVQRGYDIEKYVLNCFGGAGGQHACQVAEKLGIKNILIHPLAGVLSAYGIGEAELRCLEEMQCGIAFNDSNFTTLVNNCNKLAKKGEHILLQQGAVKAQIRTSHKLHLRYAGTDTTLEIALNIKDTAEVSILQSSEAFKKKHLQQFGFLSDDTIVAESIVVELVEQKITPPAKQHIKIKNEKILAETKEYANMYSHGKWRSVPVYKREALKPNSVLEGEALIIEKTGTVVVLKGWTAIVDDKYSLILQYKKKNLNIYNSSNTIAYQHPDPIRLEIFNSIFMSIAEQMGLVLAKTSFSVNIKERHDYSCALFDAQGNLVANAPHVPVHLGSMSDTIREIIKKRHRSLKEGDSYAHNDPYAGGTHLPDITVVTPVFINNEVVFYVASRGHHADIGGTTPGSCPPDSTVLEEEGVLIKDLLLVREEVFQREELLNVLTQAKYPARNPEHNVADLKAQIAANATGVQELKKLVEIYSLVVVKSYMLHVQKNAEESVRSVIHSLQAGSFTYLLDNGNVLKVKIIKNTSKREATIDFTGTSLQHSGNYNAPFSITRAAIMYVFRILCGKYIPMNEGCLTPLRIISPSGSFINPKFPAAVVAGNTEISQAIVDCLLGALGKMASSQGTMNNFVYGNDHFQNYETICGGVGACSSGNGATAVHSHMTNTRMTDPEVIETRFPIRVADFSVRHGSGGSGHFTGGDGVVRKIIFLSSMKVTVLSSHRVTEPYGVMGGLAGKKGVNKLIRANGVEEPLGGNCAVAVKNGDMFVMKTPGGGGYGAAK